MTIFEIIESLLTSFNGQVDLKTVHRAVIRHGLRLNIVMPTLEAMQTHGLIEIEYIDKHPHGGTFIKRTVPKRSPPESKYPLFDPNLKKV